MSTFTKEEYLKLVTEMAESQYDLDAEDVVQMEWLPAQSAMKDRLIEASHNGSVDLTTAKRDKVKDMVLKCRNHKIGKFLVKITHYRDLQDELNRRVDVTIYHEVSRTMSGAPCNGINVLNVAKDSRFEGRPWLKHFIHGSSGHNIPVDTFCDIVRWIQAVDKLPAFV